MKAISYYTAGLAIFFTFVLFSSYTGEDASLPVNTERTNQLPQIIRPVDLNKAFNFAGEPLPMENFDVRERLDRELIVNSYRHSSTILNMKKASRYFPVIEPILAKNGIPDDFKYLAVAESDLRNATSPAGAKGFWQFMRGTAKDYGLQVANEIDERYHLEKATEAACKHLRKLHNMFGSWSLAAAAYNVGQSKLRSELEKQRGNTLYDLNLNQETSRYLFRVVALKEIISNPHNFGFDISDALYPPLDNYAVVEVNTSIPSWGDFARNYGTTYRMLKIYNPWLTTGSLQNKSGRVYWVKIPKK